MLITDTSGYSRNSSRPVLVVCDSKATLKCNGEYIRSYRDYMNNVERNGKYICLVCSRHIKHSGRNNPNCHYTINDNFFASIDSNEKAYLLGWIASDGHVNDSGFSIQIHEKDVEILEHFPELLGDCSIPIKRVGKNMVSFTVNSQKISQDICLLLRICPGKKSYTVKFPGIDEKYQIAFIRGYFDGDGSVIDPQTPHFCNYPRCNISSNSKEMLNIIYDIMKIPGSISGIGLEYSGNNALDFLGKIYADKSFPVLSRKYNIFLLWGLWEQSVSGYGAGGRIFSARWAKANRKAISPSKARTSDSGYDLSVIEKISDNGIVSLYDTGIKIQPDFGWYFIVVPRSSIYKLNYCLANSIGIIDRTYTGTIKIPLIKLDKTLPDLELPSRIVQIIPQRAVNFEIEEVNVEEIEVTTRADGGFGSTDKEDIHIVKTARAGTGGIVTQMSLLEFIPEAEASAKLDHDPDYGTQYEGKYE